MGSHVGVLACKAISLACSVCWSAVARLSEVRVQTVNIAPVGWVVGIGHFGGFGAFDQANSRLVITIKVIGTINDAYC